MVFTQALELLMPYVIQIKDFNREHVWGPYESKDLAEAVKKAYIGNPENATVHYIGNPETLTFDARPRKP
jgi:hypothetical protein